MKWKPGLTLVITLAILSGCADASDTDPIQDQVETGTEAQVELLPLSNGEGEEDVEGSTESGTGS